MRTNQYIDLESKYGANNYHPLDVIIEKAAGIWMYDIEGNKYLDFLSGYSALNQGHCHPRIVKLIKEQVDKLTLTSRAFRNNQYPLWCQELCELSGMEKMLPMNSGAEAVETAIKAVRKWGYKIKKIQDGQAEIITCANNFHGRTTTIVSFSTEPLYKDDFGPYTPGFKTINFGDAAALEAAITPHTCAFMLEPIQGEAGIIIPPAGYLQKVREICSRNNVLLIVDEIQTGLGRTGKLFAFEHEGIRPDGIIIGKALSAGTYPISAFLASREVMDVFKPGEHGSTFGGNPLASAIAREALKILTEEKLIENSKNLGAYFAEKLKIMSSKSSIVKEVRGMGLLIGVELHHPARSYCEKLMQEGLLCKETHDYVIRFAPPLIIKKEEIDWAVEKIQKVLAK